MSGERTRLTPAGLLSGIRGAGYLRKWLVLGTVIGVVAGVGAIVFVHALELATQLLLVHVGGYTPPTPAGEGAAAGSVDFVRPWAVPLVVALGGLASGVLVFSLAPEAEGHGTDAAIEAVHHHPRGIRARVSLIKIIASALTIGSGGSAGREGPTAQISASFGSLLARRLDLTPEDARIAVTVGIGAGIGAIFRAPLGGAVLGAEILYREDVESEALLPSIVASIIGFSIYGAVEGFTPIFGFMHGYHFLHPVELLFFALLGIAAGLVGRLYSGCFYGVVDRTRRLPGNPMWKPAAAGLLVGSIGLILPGVLGTGYGWVQAAMSRELLNIPMWIVLLLPFAKIVATSLSIGSGGSGGIFGPGMVIGGFLGAGLWRVLEPVAATMPDSPAPFVVVGMIACFGSISHAYLAVLLMVAEMTGSLSLFPPAMIALGLAALVVGDNTIYKSQLASRAESAAYRIKLGLPMLATVPVTEAMASPRLVLEEDATVRAGLEGLTELGLPGAPVVNRHGGFMGAVETEHMRGLLEEFGGGPIRHALDPSWPALTEGAALDDVVDALASNDVNWITILDASGGIRGIIGMTELIDGYRRSLSASLRRFGGVAKETVLVEGSVTEESGFAWKTVAEAGWPAGTVVLSVQRKTHLLFPEGDTVLETGDVVSVLARAENEESLRERLAGVGRYGEGSESDGAGPGFI